MGSPIGSTWYEYIAFFTYESARVNVGILKFWHSGGRSLNLFLRLVFIYSSEDAIFQNTKVDEISNFSYSRVDFFCCVHVHN